MIFAFRTSTTTAPLGASTFEHVLQGAEQAAEGPDERPGHPVLVGLDGTHPTVEERGRARLRFHKYHDDGSSARLVDGVGISRR